jgi:hypothetical protein
MRQVRWKAALKLRVVAQIIAAMNSGPLYAADGITAYLLRTKDGAPREANSGLSAAMTAWLVQDTPTVTDSHSRVNSSRMFRRRTFRPEMSASSWKS